MNLPKTSYLYAVLIVIVVTMLCFLTHEYLALANLLMLYLLGVAVISSKFGRVESIIGCVLSVALFDFFFVPPYWTFHVADKQYLISFALMTCIALLISKLTFERIQLRADSTNAKLQIETERVRNVLLSSVSHDLRTPLTIIQGTADLIGNQTTDIEARDLALTIVEQTKALNKHVRNLLDLTKLESGIRLHLEWNSVEELVGSALGMTTRLLEAYPLKVSVPEDFPLVFVDGVLMERVLLNLLENVARHTPPGTHVSVSATHESDTVSIVVSDSGPGIPAGSNLFKPFEQAYRSSSDGGFGLGLSICRAILKLHQGTITARGNEGGGTSFEVIFPVRPLQVGSDGIQSPPQ